MEVLLINKEFSGGGAASACRRILSGLSNNKELNVKLLVQNYSGSNIRIVSVFKRFGKYKSLLNLIIEKLHFLLYEASADSRFKFSTAIYGSSIKNIKEVKKAEYHSYSLVQPRIFITEFFWRVA